MGGLHLLLAILAGGFAQAASQKSPKIFVYDLPEAYRNFTEQ
jgi:hypothetical protein